MTDEELVRRARELDWLLLDVDGVLTDGRLYYGPDGEAMKVFDVRDGLALRLARHAGIKVGILSGRSSPALERRARELVLDAIICGSEDKMEGFQDFLAEKRAAPARVAYVGDDLQDLAVMGRCGLAFAPADAAEEVRAAAHRTLARPGGRGVAREAVELLLRARGEWNSILARFAGR